MVTYTQSGSVSPRAPFDFAKSLGFVEMFTPTQREQHIQAQQLTKAINVGGHAVGYSVKSSGSIDHPHLDYTLYTDQPITEELTCAALDRLSFYLSVDDDLKQFYALANDDPCMAPIVQRLYGLHQVKFPTPFEIAAWAVLTQRMPIRIARQVKDRVVARYGGSVEIDGKKLWAFPDAAQIAAADPDELLTVIKNERKVQYLFAVAHAFQSIEEDFLTTGDLAAVESWLRDIKGIGEWSARFILIRGLGRMEHLSSTEKHLTAAAKTVYGPGCDVAAIGARYGVQQGYWAYYLRTTAG